MARTIVGLDIGTCWIRVVIAEINSSGEIEIIGVSKKPSQGVRNGVIVNIEAAKNVIKDAIDEAEQSAGTTVLGVYISIGGSQVTSMPSSGAVAIDPSERKSRDKIVSVEVNEDAKARVLKCAESVSIPLNEVLLNNAPQCYFVDGIEYENPIGIKGVRLEVKTLLLKVSTSAYANIEECIRRAEYISNGVSVKTIVAAQAVLRKDERELGSVLIDLGGGSTDVVVLYKDAPVFTTSIPYGGNTVTTDISAGLGIPFSIAEDLKLKYGTCWFEGNEENEEVIIPGIGGLAPELTNRHELGEIIQARVQEILEDVVHEVARNSGLKLLQGTIVLTGGGALMQGIETLTQSVWQTSAVRIGLTQDYGGTDDSYRSADFATAVGLVLVNKKRALSVATPKVVSKKQSAEKKKNIFARFINKIK